MIPSKKLRQIIESKYNLPISDYAWNEKLEKLILSIKLDPYIEDKVSSLKEVYELGLNIGHCGVTSRYFSINLKEALMHYGYLDILRGTKSSLKGGHAWVEYDGYIIDPTLMILLPISLKDTFGYKTESILAKSSSLMLSEYDTYSNEYSHLLESPEEYTDSLYKMATDPTRK